MKKISGIFAVSMIAIMTAGAARADIAATTYVDTEVGTRVKIDQGADNASKAVVTDAKGQVTVGKVAKDMLADAVQTSLGLADTALQASDISGKVDVDQKVENKDKAVITDATGQITTGKIASGMIADDAVTTVKIKDANVTAAKLAADAVTTVKIKDANVTTAKIADKNVTKAKLADAVQTSLGLADTALQASDISGKVDVDQKVANKDKAVITDATGQITTGQIASDMIADNAVTTEKIKDTNVTKAKLDEAVQKSLDLADSALQASDISGKVDVDQKAENKDKAVITNASGKITTGYIANGMIASNAVTTVKIKDANVTSEKIADSAITAGKISATQLAENTKDLTKVGNYALTLKVAEGGAQTLVWEYIGR